MASLDNPQYAYRLEGQTDSDWTLASTASFPATFQGANNARVEVKTKIWSPSAFINTVDALDADYQAVLTYATTQGYTLPSLAQRTIQSDLVTELKAAGVWAKLDSFAVMATDGDANFALIDWKRLVQFTAVNSPAFTINQGYKGDAISSYINLNFNASTSGVNYTLNAASYGYWKFSNPTSNSGYSMGNNIGDLLIRDRITTLNRINSTNSLAVNINFDGIGFRHLNRSTSTNVQAIIDGVTTSSTQTSTGLPNNLQLFNAGSTFTDSEISIAFAGGDLSAEASDFYAAVNTYMAAI